MVVIFLGDNFPPDEVNKVDIFNSQILDYGFPFCYGNNSEDPTYNHTCSFAEFVPAAASISPHAAPLGLVFYTGSSFPSSYHNQMFFVTHGSTFRTPKDGYNIMFAELDPTGQNVISVDIFAHGWLLTNQTVWGRPDAILVDPSDGSLLISDDRQNMLYRIQYVGNSTTATYRHSTSKKDE